MFGSLHWTNLSQRKVQSKARIDTTAITGPGPNLRPHLTPQLRAGLLQLGWLQLEVRVLLDLLQTRGPQGSITYQYPLYLVL